MTPRKLRITAAILAVVLQVAMIVVYGMATRWCFCAHTGAPDPHPPPLFMLGFLELVALPAEWMRRGLPLPVLVVLNLAVWFEVVLALLYGLRFAARVRVYPLRRSAGRRRLRFRLGRVEGVRAWQMVALGCLVIGTALAFGAMARGRWLAEAERVLAETLSAASEGRPLPAGVEEFWMSEGDGDDLRFVTPEPRYTLTVDPRESGDHFLDRFVTPRSYGGVVRFESGRRWRFFVGRRKGPWSVMLFEVRGEAAGRSG